MRLIFRAASAMFILVFPVIHNNIVTLRKGLDDPRHRDPKSDKLLNIHKRHTTVNQSIVETVFTLQQNLPYRIKE